ncbi:hypothetical protein [Sphingomonas melonis]|uniref:hypothetical protein n=1 Tax=Sphingomonas melonis TaxID=152682 RepID=UPI0035C872E4
MQIAIRINITDPQLVYDRAVESYLRDGNAPEDVKDRFGTRDDPKLVECATEIAAEADHGGLFEFLD